MRDGGDQAKEARVGDVEKDIYLVVFGSGQERMRRGREEKDSVVGVISLKERYDTDCHF